MSQLRWQGIFILHSTKLVGQVIEDTWHVLRLYWQQLKDCTLQGYLCCKLGHDGRRGSASHDCLYDSHVVCAQQDTTAFDIIRHKLGKDFKSNPNCKQLPFALKGRVPALSAKQLAVSQGDFFVPTSNYFT